MYESGVPEKLIQERTGQRLLEALQSYERSIAGQHQAVSEILSAPQQQMYHHTTKTRSLCLALNSLRYIHSLYLECPSRTHMDAPLTFMTKASLLEVPLTQHSHSSLRYLMQN